jgi:hypothetical protein
MAISGGTATTSTTVSPKATIVAIEVTRLKMAVDAHSTVAQGRLPALQGEERGLNRETAGVMQTRVQSSMG